MVELIASRCEKVEQRTEIGLRLPEMPESDVGPLLGDSGSFRQGVVVEDADDEVEELGDLQDARHRCSANRRESGEAHLREVDGVSKWENKED